MESTAGGTFVHVLCRGYAGYGDLACTLDERRLDRSISGTTERTRRTITSSKITALHSRLPSIPGIHCDGSLDVACLDDIGNSQRDDNTRFRVLGMSLFDYVITQLRVPSLGNFPGTFNDHLC